MKEFFELLTVANILKLVLGIIALSFCAEVLKDTIKDIFRK